MVVDWGSKLGTQNSLDFHIKLNLVHNLEILSYKLKIKSNLQIPGGFLYGFWKELKTSFLFTKENTKTKNVQLFFYDCV